jgi:hypothetical protein
MEESTPPDIPTTMDLLFRFFIGNNSRPSETVIKPGKAEAKSEVGA